jgi:hypothetical protein
MLAASKRPADYGIEDQYVDDEKDAKEDRIKLEMVVDNIESLW